MLLIQQILMHLVDKLRMVLYMLNLMSQATLFQEVEKLGGVL